MQPASGFIAFADNEIEQSIPERFEKQVRAGGNRVAIRSDRELYTFDSAQSDRQPVSSRDIGAARQRGGADRLVLRSWCGGFSGDHGGVKSRKILRRLGCQLSARSIELHTARLRRQTHRHRPKQHRCRREICDDSLDVIDFTNPDVSLTDHDLGVTAETGQPGDAALHFGFYRTTEGSDAHASQCARRRAQSHKWMGC